jgi:hypothetical protein
MANLPRRWCKGWIQNHDLRLDIGLAIDDERLHFATWIVIGKWYERLGFQLASAKPRLLFNFEETMLAANLRRNKVIDTLDQRVFRKRRKKPPHFTLGAVFDSFGGGPSPLIVVATFFGAEELFVGQ